MKIAVFHELHEGGARRAANELAKRFKKKHQVDLYLVNPKNNTTEDDFYTKIFYYPFVTKQWKGNNWKVRLYKDTYELYKLYLLHKKIAQMIAKRNYDVVLVHPSQFTQAPFILRFLKNKTVYYCEEPLRIAYESEFVVDPSLSFLKKTYEKSIRFIRKQIDRRNITSSKLILANSEFTRDNIKKAYNLESIVCYLGVDINAFKPRKVKKEFDILYIGAKNNIDGYFLLESAVKKLKKKPTVKWHIFGENWLKDEKEFIKLYGKSKIVVCLAKNEPFGLIPLEAMACGLPVMALHEGGYRETIIDGKTGFFVNGHPLDLAKKIEILIHNEKLQNNLGSAARKHTVANWSWEKSAQQIEKILKR